MSLILEALRKSEAERRLGSAPDLLTVMPILRASEPRRRWPLAMAGGLLLVVLASTWWWARNTQTVRAIVAVAPVTQGTARAAVDATNNVRREPPQAHADVRTLRLPPPITNASRIAAPIPPPVPVATPAEPLPSATEPVQSASASTTTASPTPAAEPALLSLADLSADERNSLPALKVSMHVYADDPSHRFMIIDGQRVGEGARLADGVVLVRIRRDGAELDVRGRRLLLTKP